MNGKMSKTPAQTMSSKKEHSLTGFECNGLSWEWIQAEQVMASF